MTRASGFGRTLVFGALAALGLPAALALGAPLFGNAPTLRAAVVGLALAYVAILARGAADRVAAVAAAAVGGAALLVLPLGTAHTAVGAAALVALCRSGLLHRRPLPRALALEAALAAAGLALAALFAGPGAPSLALAVWGYFLVQSAFFLVGGARRPEAAVDPFDRACRRLQRLLEDARGPVR